MRRRSGRPPHQQPYRRRNPSGAEVWVARYRDLAGYYRYAKPDWNGGKATFERKARAQEAIDEALELVYNGGPVGAETVDAYFETWTKRHPRSDRTNETNEHRITRVLHLELDGRAFGAWRFDELSRRHVSALVDGLLRDQGRAVQGVRNILSALSSMCEDAIADEVAAQNPFKGLRLRKNDPRAQKASRVIRLWTFEQMRVFAGGGRPEVRARTRKPNSKRCYPPYDFEALLLTPGLTGARLGEVLALRREDFDGESVRVRMTAHEGKLIGTSGQKNHDRLVPVPPSLASLVRAATTRFDTDLLFPTPTGKLWRERNFYRDVWEAARRATGLDPTPHEFRHSYVSHLRAAGVDDADLARVAGHSVETMISRYTHALGHSDERIREAIG